MCKNVLETPSVFRTAAVLLAGFYNHDITIARFVFITHPP